MDATSRTDAVDRALDSLRGQIQDGEAAGRRRRLWTTGRLARTAALGVLFVTLPFLLLVKMSVALYSEAGMHAWLALAVAASATAVLLVLLTMGISYRIRMRFRVTLFTFRTIGVLVGMYCLYSVLFISGSNVKSPGVAETYGALHPLLRLSVSTFVLVDDGLVVTDAARSREDYRRMGLPVNEASMHFRQSSGFVHAVDLRTDGRSSARNATMAGYFRLMGFRTLRHVGTADHLHVSLPVR